jgi:superfamily I DNA and RNA helicase
VKKSWWRKQADLDEHQKRVVDLPTDGKYLLTGPPGSGKTNLLLLRAMYLSSASLKDVIFLTVGRTLKEFIATGVGAKGLLGTEQIDTYRTWVMRFLAEHSPQFMNTKPVGDYDDTQALYVAELDRVTQSMPPLYDAIVVDEVQDLLERELVCLTRLSSRLMVAGDIRQQIYSGGKGVDAALVLGFEHVRLRYHYRIGRRICEVADSVYPPVPVTDSLSQTCNYDEKEFASSVQLTSASSLEEQVELALQEIRVQLSAFPGESIGIFVPKNKQIDQIRDQLLESDLGSLVAVHESKQGASRGFDESRRIYVMTVYSAKGTEFRAVHVLAAEGLRGRAGTRKLVFTAFTRAKTSLSVYYTGKVQGFIASAFAKPTTPTLEELFE